MEYLFANNRQHAIKLPSKNGKMVYFAPNERKVLDAFFKRYVPKQLKVIKQVSYKNKIDTINKSRQKSSNVRIIRRDANNEVNSKIQRTRNRTNVRHRSNRSKRIVGKAGVIGRDNATNFSKSRIEENSIALSNDIGIGILSFNRLESLIHLIESIRKYTDLNKTTVFVSDESTDNKTWQWLKDQKDIVAFHNERCGIAVNSNRILRCLKRFKYKILLNDDVEILKPGWDDFYFKMMNRYNLKHFCYRQKGIYGASRKIQANGLVKTDDKPHGAVMAIHDDAFKKVGYFDENFGVYGFEHVDYSNRIARACHNRPGYFDVGNADQFFKIYNDTTSDSNKHINYRKSKEYYDKVKLKKDRIFVNTSDKSIVKGISCIIPFRDIGRSKCITTVINNIKTLKHPEVQIILVEQDDKNKFNLNLVSCIEYELAKSSKMGMHFSKSFAFNTGVNKSKFEKIILHDADMLVRSDYSRMIDDLLDKYDSVHIGKTVCYMEKESTNKIVNSQSIDRNNVSSDRIVNYYEGGSLAIRRKSYIDIGGFCEKFIGYGCEDCEFYHRMVNGTNSYVIRSIDLFHLWHDRINGWTDKHEVNKNIHERLKRMNQKSLMLELSQYLKNKYNNIN